MQRLEKILAKKPGSKSARMAKLWQFWQGHPKPACSEEVQRGDQEKFFKNRPKSSPGLKGLKARWRRKHYPLITILLKCKHRRNYGTKSGSKRARIAKLWQFSQGQPKLAFFENVPKGEQGKFFKNRPKSSPRLKGPKALWRKWPYPVISMHFNAKTGKDLGAYSGSKSAQMAKLWQFSQGHPRPAFSEKVHSEEEGKFFQNPPKSSPRMKSPKTLWRKATQNPHFLKKCKGRTKRNF